MASRPRWLTADRLCPGLSHGPSNRAPKNYCREHEWASETWFDDGGGGGMRGRAQADADGHDGMNEARPTT